MHEGPLNSEELAPVPTGGLQPLTINADGVMSWAAGVGVPVPDHTHSTTAGQGGQLTPIVALTPVTGTGSAVLATEPSIVRPRIDTIHDNVRGLAVLTFTANASAANYFEMIAKASGGDPQLKVNGIDANIDMNLMTIGSGVVKANSVEVARISGAQSLSDKTLVLPIITDFTNAQHDHGDADDGGPLALAAIPAHASTHNTGGSDVIAIYVGCTGIAAGVPGTVPNAAPGQQAWNLRGDAGWTGIAHTSRTTGSGSDTLTANYSAVVNRKKTIASGNVLALAAGSIYRIL